MRASAGPRRRQTEHGRRGPGGRPGQRLARLAAAAAGPVLGSALVVVLGSALVVAGAVAAPAASATLHVDRSSPSCSSSGPGSATAPYCSIARAAAAATAGQTVLVRPGSYPESVTVGHSGTAAAPIVLRSLGGVTVRGGSHGFTVSSRSWVTVQGFTVTGTAGAGIYVKGSSHVAIVGNHVTRSGRPSSGDTAQGIRLESTSDSRVAGNTTDHNSEAGILLAGGSTRNQVAGNESFANARGYTRAAPGIDVRAPGNSVTGNRSHDNEDTGIQSYTGASDTLIAGNVAYANGDHGIDNLNAPGQRITGNTVYGNVTAGINVEGSSPGAVVERNVSVDNGIGSPRTKGNIRVDSTSVRGARVDYNTVWLSRPGVMYTWGKTGYRSLAAFRAATGQEAHGRQANPL